MTTTVLPLLMPMPAAPPLVDDLRSAGLEPLPSTACDMLVRDALRQSPGLVVCCDAAPADGLLVALERLAAAAPSPVLVFTQDSSVEAMQRALRAGVHGWVVNGYARERLRALAQLTRERFEQQRELREALADLRLRYAERQRVDRAKGLLMRASQISEEAAFRALRQASMDGNRRVGQISQQVIDAARDAEAINLAGQLRMLSQRVVKLAALVAAGTDPTRHAALLEASLQRATANLDALDRLLSRPTFGDLLDTVRGGWRSLGQPLAAPSLDRLDAHAEHCLNAADRLVDALESAGSGPSLRVVNLCGRQRMLSQRVAKCALLGTTSDDSVAAFERALSSLRALRLTTPHIAATLDAAGQAWTALLGATRLTADAAGRAELAESSEALLELFERLTERYERSVELLIGAG